MDSTDPNLPAIPSSPITKAPASNDPGQVIMDLVRELEDDLYLYLFRGVRNLATADELLQETLLRLWVSRDRFDSSRPGRPWVMRIAKSVLFTHYRSEGASKRRRPRGRDERSAARSVGERDAGEPRDRNLRDPLESLMLSEDIAAMDDAASKLNSRDRELYMLRREGRSAEQIAAATGRTQSSIGPALTRLAQRLRAHMPRS